MAAKKKAASKNDSDQQQFDFVPKVDSDQLQNQSKEVANSKRTAASLSSSTDLTSQALSGNHEVAKEKVIVPNEVILASAGTGKTFQLSNRYIKLLALGHDPRQILATTFTKKAAGEILERIVQRLTEAALTEVAASSLSEFIDYQLTTVEARVLLRRLIRSLNTLQIGTLDGFFGQVARSFCFELELPQNWQIVSDQEESRLQNRAISLTMQETGVLELLHLMSKGEVARGVGQQMRSAVAEIYSIYSQTEEAAWLIPGAVSKSEFPKSDRLRLTLPEVSDQMSPKAVASLENLLELVDGHRWEEIVGHTLVKNVRSGSGSFNRKRLPESTITAIEFLIAQVDQLFITQLQERNVSAYKLLTLFDKHYHEMKSASGDLRFDNVQHRLARWVGELENPASRMVARLDFRIEHLLLDEFQDTVPQQWKILFPIAKAIADPVPTGAGSAVDQGTLFCVGDQKQAIYRWRGGDSRIFGTVKDSFKSVQQRAMNTSFRSSPVVLDAVNRVFENLHRHPSAQQWEGLVEQWAETFQSHKAAVKNESLSGYVTLEQVVTQELDLLEKAAQRIAELYHATEGFSIGVLVPKNDDVAKILGFLTKLGVPASEESGNPLSDSAAIEIIVSLLQVIDHPGDTASWFHVLFCPVAPQLLTGLSLEELQLAKEALTAISSGKSRLETAASDDAKGVSQASRSPHEIPDERHSTKSFESKQAGKQDPNLRDRLAQWSMQMQRRILEVGLGPVVSDWAQALATIGSDRDQTRLRQATAAAFGYENPTPLRSSEFGRYLSQLKRLERTSARVRVMNIHQSKGLEFDIVVLTSLEGSLSTNIAQAVIWDQPDLTKDPSVVCRYTNSDNWPLLPLQYQKMFQTHKREHCNERLCQLYVGMTRARRALHMIVNQAKGDFPQSPAGILKSSLIDRDDEAMASKKKAKSTEAPLDTVWFCSGDPNWAQPIVCIATEELPVKLGEAATPLPAVASSRRMPAIAPGQKILLAPDLRNPVRGLPRTSPSSLEGGSRFPLVSLLSDPDRQTAFLKGQIIHGWFELILWLEDQVPSEEELVNCAAKIEMNRSLWEDWIPEFQAMLQLPSVVRLLSRAFYQQPNLDDFPQQLIDDLQANVGVKPTQALPLELVAQNERPFAILDNGQLMNGFIDRLVVSIHNDKVVAADVVDFKTDRFEDPPSADAIEAKVQHYRPQLEAYCNAVARLTGLPVGAITARLVFVSIDQVRRI